MNDLLGKNVEGYSDPTTSVAIENADKKSARSEGYARFRTLLNCIFSLCEIAGFHLEGRIVVKDKKTGKIWR